MAEQIRIVYCPLDEPPVISWVDNTLEAMQKLVGGYIETATVGKYVLVCNEDGRLLGMPQNPCLEEYVGPVFFTRTDGDEFVNLSVADAQLARALFLEAYGSRNDKAAVSG